MFKDIWWHLKFCLNLMKILTGRYMYVCFISEILIFINIKLTET